MGRGALGGTDQGRLPEVEFKRAASWIPVKSSPCEVLSASRLRGSLALPSGMRHPQQGTLGAAALCPATALWADGTQSYFMNHISHFPTFHLRRGRLQRGREGVRRRVRWE